MTGKEEDRKQRWRMVMGSGGDDALGHSTDSVWIQRERLLSFLYDREYDGSRNPERNTRKRQSAPQGLGDSNLTVPDWINGVHELFPRTTVEQMEKDALERYEVQEMVTNPDVLSRAQPNEALLKAVLRTKHLMNQEVLSMARLLVSQVIDELAGKFSHEIQSSMLGPRDRRRRTYQNIAKNLDTRTTILTNLKHYQIDSGKLVIEKPVFLNRSRKHSDRWEIIILVDQSGSMLECVIHAAVMASIFYGLPSLKTSLIAFDTNIIDLSEDCGDPVETLMKVQLGGGTDIGNACAYASGKIHNPRKTIVVIVSDFFEAAPEKLLLSRLSSILECGAQVIGLPALDSSATPVYNHELALKIVRLGARVQAMTPGELASWIAGKVG